MRTVRVKEEALRAMATQKLVGAGFSALDAKCVTDVLIYADLTGVHSHGVMRVEHYCQRVMASGLNAAAEHQLEAISPSVGILDANDGLGHPALAAATKHAIEMASDTGLGFVSIKKASHCGALSYFMNMATDAGMIGLGMTQTDACMAPHGGGERFLGTNPIAFGFPVEGSHPMIIDMATSATAFGKLLHAKETGSEIPLGVAIDVDGNETTDPHKVESLLPFGGHKGSGIALAIDALTGILMGANYGNNIVGMYSDYDKMRELASLVIVINPEFFGNPLFSHTMASMIGELRAVTPAPGFDKVLAPNDPQMDYKLDCLEHGVPVAGGVYEFLTS
ncbi:ureidoglycolate dehydrogenase [Vibrio sp. 10N.286.49.B3]|uniref:Ldh family oxidoreductase n=1 Tax=Vibrio sp. 10N.286.49.B3 TaxID=1880855 RepID=UPI000C856297|nr:Ldh family oxidoreductase [Vibrio sp. 10N.286.49.B3]PMH45328.1 ureidoglycolate dehydrogenase [Vibrio sp. 10N.286.49.B3]